jgi:succinate dehydrogenase / fumarate reductase cytochrome b subunit
MAAQQRPLSPHLSVYKLPLAARLSILHRATGVLISAGAFVLAFWLTAIAAGESEYADFLACATSLPGRVLLFAILASFLFHLLTGLRHLFWDIGWGLDLKRTQATSLAVLLLAVLGAGVVAWLVFAGVRP